MTDICFRRLEELRQAVLLNYLEEIQFEKASSFYEVLMNKFFAGELDQYFLSNSLVEIDFEENKEIFQLVRKYKDLCFYMGDFHYWADSIGGVYLNDLDLVSMKILDHYDFLLGLAKDGGEEPFKLLTCFQNSFMSKEGSVVDYLRNRFDNDDVLKRILIEMSKEDGQFNDLNSEQKRILCTYPKGILFQEEDGSTLEVPVAELVQSLAKEYSQKNVEECDTFSDLGDLLLDNHHFEEVVMAIYLRTQKVCK